MFFNLLSLTIALLHGQSHGPLICTASAVPIMVRSEGLTERLGDIVLNCSGGQPEAQVPISFALYLNTSITNRLSQNGTQDVKLTIDSGEGPVDAGVDPVAIRTNAVAFSGVIVTFSNTGTVTMRITNVRAPPALAPGSLVPQMVAFLGSNDTSKLVIRNPSMSIGYIQRGMTASYIATYSNSGSRLPPTISFDGLLNYSTAFTSVRFSEVFAESFVTGTRFFVRYSGFPTGVRLLVPDAVAGSSATTPTAAGDLGLQPSPGVYSANRRQLLLLRVSGADASGAGGTLAYTRLGAMSDVPMTSGSGMAVYEVADSDSGLRESVQFPAFIGFAPRPDVAVATGLVEAGFAPFSTVTTATETDPVPRFLKSTPRSDCATLADCNADRFSRLLIDPLYGLSFTAIAGSAYQSKAVRLNSASGSALDWTAFVTYKTGSGWITFDPASGTNNATVRVDVHPENLKPGTYEATLTVHAGPPAGSVPVALTLKVIDAGPPPLLPVPTIKNCFNAASLAEGPLTPGSLASVFGQNFKGGELQVTFDGIAASLLFNNETQINLQVPGGLAGKPSAQMQITVDGRSSVPVQVQLAASAPAIFPGAIVNQVYSQNKPSSPALAGSVIQIFLTGLPATGVTGIIHDRENLTPYYAGPAPGFRGVQQVNLVVPADLPAMTTEVKVCAAGVCSPAAPLTIKQ